jgi:NADPH:quinone reductase-like Zn-dependent oxidoreductase
MHKIVIHRPGGYEQLKYEEHPDPAPGPGEVLIETTSIGVNYADCCVRFGVYASAKKYVGWPITPGFELAGTVKELGSGVTNLSVGQQIFALVRFGAYATQVVAPAKQVFPLPRGFSVEHAGGFATVFLTAYHALYQCVRLRPGMTVLIHSAAGGVGSALVQLAKLADCRTIGVVGSSHKVEYVKSHGCDVAIDKSREDLWRAVERAAPDGIDVACDAVGPATLKESYRHLCPTGRLITYGFSSMLPNTGGRFSCLRGLWGFLKLPRFNPLDLVGENKGVIGFNLSFLFDRQDLLAEAMKDLLHWADEVKIRPLPVTTYPLADVAQAHQALESGQTTGKLVLVV